MTVRQGWQHGQKNSSGRWKGQIYTGSSCITKYFPWISCREVIFSFSGINLAVIDLTWPQGERNCLEWYNLGNVKNNPPNIKALAVTLILVWAGFSDTLGSVGSV